MKCVPQQSDGEGLFAECSTVKSQNQSVLPYRGVGEIRCQDMDERKQKLPVK